MHRDPPRLVNNSLEYTIDVPREESFVHCTVSTERRARAYQLFIFVPFYLVTPVERVDVLLSIADVREAVDVRYEGQARRHLLALSCSQFDPTETSSLIASEAGWVPFVPRWPVAKC